MIDIIISEIEITDFSLAWSGNAEVPGFDLKDVDTWQFSTRKAFRLISGFTSQATTFWSYDGRVGSVGIGAFAGTISDTTEIQRQYLNKQVWKVFPEPTSIVASLVALCAILLKKKVS